MYVRTSLAGAHRLSHLGRRRGVGDLADTNWTSVLDTGLMAGAQVATVAEAPTPTTSIMLPSGAVITSSGGAAIPASVLSSASSNSTLTLLFLGGAALLVVMMMRR